MTKPHLPTSTATVHALRLKRARDRRDMLICAALDAGKRQETIARQHGIKRGVVVKLAAELRALDAQPYGCRPAPC